MAIDLFLTWLSIIKNQEFRHRDVKRVGPIVGPTVAFASDIALKSKKKAFLKIQS